MLSCKNNGVFTDLFQLFGILNGGTGLAKLLFMVLSGAAKSKTSQDQRQPNQRIWFFIKFN